MFDFPKLSGCAVVFPLKENSKSPKLTKINYHLGHSGFTCGAPSWKPLRLQLTPFLLRHVAPAAGHKLPAHNRMLADTWP